MGYSVGGKSGTAHKQVGKGYATNKYRAWFTGMAPIDKPRIIVAVMIDEPSNGQYYGGAGGRARVQRSGAADAAHDGRAARHGRQAADRGQGGGGVF
jgi:cell division protein FtsI/penicillin-binding protein 2